NFFQTPNVVSNARFHRWCHVVLAFLAVNLRFHHLGPPQGALQPCCSLAAATPLSRRLVLHSNFATEEALSKADRAKVDATTQNHDPRAGKMVGMRSTAVVSS
ncbi:MAG TPA: hypothetical protein VKJ65_11175, partial [Phycisphaerae bacterium]|nr:hypothetical protein [Phycisphaerae bacterium]